MAEEFQESEVIFSDHFASDEEYDPCLDHGKPTQHSAGLGNPDKFHCQNGGEDASARRKNKKKKKRNRSRIPSSLPIDIPENMYRCASEDEDLEEEEFDEDEGVGGGGMVPPHVIVARRTVRGNMAFSVCSGNGGKLKGRDFFRVRNSVLRMTGFLEA